MEKVASPKQVRESGKDYDSKLVEMIEMSIVDRSPSVKWEDVGENWTYFCIVLLPASRLQIVDSVKIIAAGLEKAKQALMEMVILPTKRRDLFTGLRKPARGNNLLVVNYSSATY